MYSLALDTSMAACSVALATSKELKLKSSRFEPMDKGQAEALAPMVQELMSAAGVKFSDLNQILVTCGPGTFTGLRIGLSFAKGLSLACGIPLFAVDSLSALTCNEAPHDLPLMVAITAGPNDFYIATYSALKAPDLAPCLMARGEVVSLLQSTPFRLLGSGADQLMALGEFPGTVRSLSGDVPRAENFIQFIQYKDYLREARPLYLRAPDIKKPAEQNQPNQITLLPVAGEASPLLAALHERCFSSPWGKADFTSLLHSSNCRAQLVCLGVEPVGFILVREAADEAEVLTIGVLAAHRQSGLAAHLLRITMAEMSGRGVAAIFLEVASDNQPALNLYKSCGFQQAGLRRDYYHKSDGSSQDALVLRKDLNPKSTL